MLKSHGEKEANVTAELTRNERTVDLPRTPDADSMRAAVSSFESATCHLDNMSVWRIAKIDVSEPETCAWLMSRIGDGQA